MKASINGYRRDMVKLYDVHTMPSTEDPGVTTLTFVVSGVTYHFYRVIGSNGRSTFFFPDLVVACDRRVIMEEFLASYHQSTFLLQVPLLNAEHEFVHKARVRTLRYRLSMNHHARVIQVRRNLTHSFTHLSVLGVIMHI